MKIIFTADWHIKLGQKNIPIDWQINRYNMLVDLLNLQQADLMIIGGDIFDRVPTIDELNLYFNLIAKINKNTFIYSGNHEASGKTSTFLSKLKEITLAVNKKVQTIDRFENINTEWNVLPYNQLREFAASPGDYKATSPILFTHVRGDIPPHVTAEIPLDLLDKWEIVFAGDLHSHSNSQLNIVYPGSPLTTSFHRNEVKTGYLLIDSKTGEWEWKNLNLPQLIRLTISDPKLMIPTKFHHTIYEIEGDLADLSKVEKHELLDKKIVSTTSESSLALHRDMKVSEELQLFLADILKLQPQDIKEILNVYHATITENAVE